MRRHLEGEATRQHAKQAVGRIADPIEHVVPGDIADPRKGRLPVAQRNRRLGEPAAEQLKTGKDVTDPIIRDDLVRDFRADLRVGWFF